MASGFSNPDCRRFNTVSARSIPLHVMGFAERSVCLQIHPILTAIHGVGQPSVNWDDPST